jgi:DNA-binding GntR family transcriptional regulator
MLGSLSPQLIKTKQQLAYENIRHAIIQGKYEPGKKLVANKIAKALGVSYIPVREALRKLESEGFLQNTPNMGFSVKVPDFKNYSEIFKVRQFLEADAAAMAAKNMRPRVLAKLKKILEKMKTASSSAETIDGIMLGNLDFQFHDLIFASCGNNTLYSLILQIWPLSPRTNLIFSLFPNRIPISVREHEELYSRLEAKDSEGAKEAHLRHKQKAYDLLMQYKRDLPFTDGQKS